MATIRGRTEEIRRFILEAVKAQEPAIATKIAEHFGFSRQSATRHINALIADGAIIEDGKGRNRTLRLAQEKLQHITIDLNKNRDESEIWEQYIKPYLDGITNNAISIWEYAVTEMVNNAIDHSNGDKLTLALLRSPTDTTIFISDNGIGIFKKIQEALDLSDKRHAVLELAKGKMTTAPKRHTGEGIFFTSRSVDSYCIMSDGISFTHHRPYPMDLITESEISNQSTNIIMTLSNHSKRTLATVFKEFAPADEYTFSKTIVPVRMATLGGDSLISRSQARRVMNNLDKFNVVILDFADIKIIGQGFADEIFRVYCNAHPQVELHPINVGEEVQKMINHVTSA